MENCVVLRMPPDVPNVKLIVATKSGTPWGDILFACNGDPGSEPTLVYCRSKEDCRVLIKEFGAAQISAVQYHGGRDAPQTDGRPGARRSRALRQGLGGLDLNHTRGLQSLLGV